MRHALIVAGPTSSGKSTLALALARELGGIVINADAMQTYQDLRILTARPTPTDEAAAPHALYGVRPAAEPSTAAWWCAAATALIAKTPHLPILCGGTGLYLNALLHGLTAIPDPGEPARTEARALLAAIGPAALHTRLAQIDPATASTIRPTDSQRLARAWEVRIGTGQGLAAWRATATPHQSPITPYAVTLAPSRATLRAAIATRWQTMLETGAIDEVRALRAQNLDPSLPALRAHGVPELSAYLDGTLTLKDASQRAILAMGQYTKRQSTWLRHHSLAPPPQTFTIDTRISSEKQLYAQNIPGLIDFLSSPIDAAGQFL